MLQARSEQPGDAPSTDAGAALQQPQSNLQPTGTTSSSTSTPQTTSPVSQQQLQAPNLRVGETQTLIANSTVAQAGADSTTASMTWLWVAIPLMVLAAVVWWIRKSTSTTVSVPVSDSAAAASPAAKPVKTPEPVTKLAVPVAAPNPQHANKAKKSAKGSRRQRKQKR